MMNPQSRPFTDSTPAMLRVLCILALASLIVYILIVGATVLKLITVSAFLAMLLTPQARWLETKRIGRFAAALLPVLGLTVGFVLFTTLAVRQLSGIAGSLDGAGERVGGYIVRLNDFMSWHLNLDEPVIGDVDREGVEDFLKDSSGKMLSMMGGLTGSLLKGFLVPALIFFVLFYRNHLFEFTVRFFRSTSRALVEQRVEAARLVPQNYFVGMLKVVGILTILNSAMLLLFGVENAIFFGAFAAVLNFVPYIGPLAGSLLPILFVFVTRENLYSTFGVAASFILIQLAESYFLVPRIIGQNVRISPLAVFIGLLGGGMIWGVVGMMIIIPVLSVAMQLCRLDPRTESFAYLLSSPPKRET